MMTRLPHLMNCLKRITLFQSIIKNLQALAMETYKISINMSPAILNVIFAPRATPYNLCNPVSCEIQKVHLVCNGTEILSHL